MVEDKKSDRPEDRKNGNKKEDPSHIRAQCTFLEVVTIIPETVSQVLLEGKRIRKDFWLHKNKLLLDLLGVHIKTEFSSPNLSFSNFAFYKYDMVDNFQLYYFRTTDKRFIFQTQF